MKVLLSVGDSSRLYRILYTNLFINVHHCFAGRLTWLVYIIGSAIGGRVSFNSNEEHDAMDGELVCRVLQLMNLTDSRLAQGGCEKLELAMLSFLNSFVKSMWVIKSRKIPKYTEGCQRCSV